MSNFTDFIGGGGGSASSINEIVYLNTMENKITFDDERVYLKGGIIETDTTTYPLASKKPSTTSTAAFVPTAYVHGLCVDSAFSTNGYYYAIFGSYSSTKLYKYSSSGTVLNTYAVNAYHSGGSMGGICFADGFLYMTGNNIVTKWSTSGVYQSQFSAGSSKGITYDGTHLWISTSSLLRKYTLSGTLVTTYTVSGGNRGLAFVAGDLWLTDSYNITQVSTQGAVKFISANNLITGITNTRAMGTNGADLLFSDQSNGVLTVSFAIGVITDAARTPALGSGQNYVRIA